MTKLHEILAVEGDVRKEAERIKAETVHTFQSKPQHFKGHVKTTTMFSEDDVTPAPEVVTITDTVNGKLRYTLSHFGNWLDVVHQKEEANQRAVADVIVGETVLLEKVPATFLLGLEAKLLAIKDLYANIPTLAPGINWMLSGDLDDVFVAQMDKETFVTRKTINSKVLYEATDHHPAEIERWTEDQRVGKNVTQSSCSMVSAGDKARMIGKLNKLITAVRQARQRANGVDINKRKVSDILVNYLLD